MADFFHADGSTWERTQKSNVLLIIVASAFMILILRLVFIQIIEGDKNYKLSVDNRVSLQVVKAQRGLIYDRYGKILADNRPSYSVFFRPDRVPKDISISEKLLKIVDQNGERLFDTLELAKKIAKIGKAKSEKHMIKEDISFGFVSIISAHIRELPGISVEIEGRREYPYGKAAFHAIGYMRQISKNEFEMYEAWGYQKDDMFGKRGIEKMYEHELHGDDGLQFVEVNAFGRQLGVVKDMPYIPPVAGNSVHLTLDAEMQRIAYEAFDDTARGALVALNPQTGEVLAMVSSPTADPNLFSLSKEKRQKEWAKVSLDSLQPLNNRTVTGLYPPASTFKLVSGLALVDHGDMTPVQKMPKPCHGTFRIGRKTVRCWNPAGHGGVNLYDAIKSSCNVYYYQLGLLLGDSVINDYAMEFGFGTPTGIDLTYEERGFLSGEKAELARGKEWTRGMVLNQAIGQSQAFTPLQIALMTAGIGNGKYRYQPYMMSKVINADNEVERRQEKYGIPIRVKESSITAVKEGMIRVIDSSGGTGRRARVRGIPVGGKSGSAQNPHGIKTHALFVAAAPLDNPTIAIAVILENAGHGGSVAAPIVGEVLNYYFDESPDGKAVAKKYRGVPDAK